MNKMRKEVKEFAEEMEKILQKHDNDKGESWKNSDIEFMLDKLAEEYTELTVLLDRNPLIVIRRIINNVIQHNIKSYIETQRDYKQIKKECVDLANISMMLFDIYSMDDGGK